MPAISAIFRHWTRVGQKSWKFANGGGEVCKLPGMGGFGSGNHREVRQTVEFCHVLSAAKLMRAGALGADLDIEGTLMWRGSATKEATGGLAFEVHTRGARGVFQVRYGFEGEKEAMNYPIEVVATRLAWGSLRWWFNCPLCRRRMEKLYLPPQRRELRCRKCWNLTYLSSQRAHADDAVFARVGRDVKMPLKSVRKILMGKMW
jgi:hypothetical protein